MLYCYKHGVHINLAMKMIGHEGKLADFLQKQKGLSLDNGRVTLKREDSALKPFSVKDEVVQILESGSGIMDIKDLKAAFVQKFNASLVSIAGMKPMDFLAKHKDVFTVTGRFVSLKAAEPEQQGPERPASVAPPPGLEQVVEQAPVDQEYLDLHKEICGESFDSKTSQALSLIVDSISDLVFLNVDHIVKGGSVGKGTAIPGASDAEVVFFVKGMPVTGQDIWLPPLLRAVFGVLSDGLGADHGVENIQIIGDSLQMSVQGLLTVTVRFSPVFQSYAKIIKSLGEQGLESRKYFTTTLAKESTLFISQQPKAVKVTIQLLKWWRDQQNWSDSIFRPTNEMLELMAVYSAVQTKPADQRTAIANVMALLSQFSELRIVWSNYYSKDDVWAPLLRQRPLLMDPTNPFVNVADAQSFDSTELMSFASSTHFFW
jgi:2'-5'-oligoadenylate synthetase/2'-5'-oligoadenylate synthase-like protein